MQNPELFAEDPMGLVGMVLPGAPGQLEAMAECFVEEYVRLGWSEARLMTLFTSPLFLATHRIYRARGEGYVRELIRSARAKWAPALNPAAATQSSPETRRYGTQDRP